YQALHYLHASPNPVIHDNDSFIVGNLNVYLEKNLSTRLRSLLEVRLLFAPNGSVGAGDQYIDTTVQDLSNFFRPIQWGAIAIERAYVEYDLEPRLTLRAGHWLTPYGIWNIDHGSPTVIGTFRPFIV